VGAESEELVAKSLRPLAAQGWTVRHSISWPGRGDIDHLVDVPDSVRFVIATKTARYQAHHVRRAQAAAHHLARYGRPCVPVICLARRHSIWWADTGVEVVSADLIAARLAQLATTSPCSRRLAARPPTGLP